MAMAPEKKKLILAHTLKWPSGLVYLVTCVQKEDLPWPIGLEYQQEVVLDELLESWFHLAVFKSYLQEVQ